jgi:hypothetical protein
VIINLLKNAREAGGPEQDVSLSSQLAADGGVTFVVRLERAGGAGFTCAAWRWGPGCRSTARCRSWWRP